MRVAAFEDLQCPDSAAWRRMLDAALLPRFSDRAAFVSKDFPLLKHNWAELAAMACRHVATISMEGALDLRRYCYDRIQDISLENLPERLVEFADARGMDPEGLILALESHDIRRAIEIDIEEGVERGVESTPTVFVGERRFVERFRVADVAAAIDEALT